jgi:hypothetical protein
MSFTAEPTLGCCARPVRFCRPCNLWRGSCRGLGVGGCIGWWDTLNCVVRWGPIGDPYVSQVPEPASDAERGVATDRERRWEQHCRPQITLDRYGVPRYLYAAPGCDYGAY